MLLSLRVIESHFVEELLRVTDFEPKASCMWLFWFDF